MLQTITQQAAPVQIQVCTNDCAFAVLENAQRLVAGSMLEQDPTASRYFMLVADIYASLAETYYMHYSEEDLVPVNAITDAIIKHFDSEFPEDASIYEDLVANTDLVAIKLENLL